VWPKQTTKKFFVDFVRHAVNEVPVGIYPAPSIRVAMLGDPQHDAVRYACTLVELVMSTKKVHQVGSARKLRKQ
jgi:hypothetical protein